MTKMWIGTSFVLALASGCVAAVGTPARIPTDAAAQCKTQCQAAGMALSALVIVSSNIGCVCNPPAAPDAPATAACSNTTGAGAAVSALLQREEAERQDHARDDSQIRSTK